MINNNTMVIHLLYCRHGAKVFLYILFHFIPTPTFHGTERKQRLRAGCLAAAPQTIARKSGLKWNLLGFKAITLKPSVLLSYFV